MDSFLHSVAQRIWSEHQHDIEHILVVFNNRRAGLFLRKELTKFGDKPFFLPTTVGIDELVAELGGQQIAPHEFLLFELFNIHRSLENVGRRYETFEDFFSLGEMMIADFSEIDLYCVDAARLFSHIKEHKRLGEWDVSGAPLSPLQEKYLNFYNSLFTYYTQLRQRLANDGIAYTGMAYRNVAENIDSLVEKIQWKHIYFVGFNALSTCERRIIECCVRRGLATLVCDGDSYYVDDDKQEAGRFIRANAQKFQGLKDFDDHFAQNEKTIHIVNCPENVLQAKATGQIVHQLLKDDKESVVAQETAIVLADEKLLLPVLNSLPKEVKTTNVTMGFPFIYSSTNNLASNILLLFCNSQNGKFYHIDVTNIFSNQLITKFLATPNLYSKTTDAINQQKIIRATKEDIEHILDGIDKAKELIFLFENATPTVGDVLQYLRRLCSLFTAADIFGKNSKEKESMACLIQIVNYLEDLQNKYNFITRIETLQKIYQRLAQRRSVAFLGKPLEGLQLLGVLETRSLDFNNVIMLSVNEGTLPAGRSSNSLIPLSLKRRYDIPVFEEKDAVYAYNLYRMIQRAKNVWLLYSSDAEGMGKGEPSRFILQIRNELAARYPNIKIEEETVVAINNTQRGTLPASVIKNQDTLKRISFLAQRGFSPSALNRYRNCPLQFFYSDIIGAQERQDINEELEANELGSFIHEILKDIYLRDKDGVVKADTLKNALQEVDRLIDNNFKDKVLKGRSEEGKNLIYCEVAKMQISHFLKGEIGSLEKGDRLEIKLLEDQMTMPFDTVRDTGHATVNLNGIADRVDSVNGLLRIADYKSGSVKNDELTVADEAPDPHSVPDKWFQVMTYALLYCHKHNYKGPFTAGIFPLRTLSSDFLAVSWNKTKTMDNTHIERFANIINTILSEILDPDTPFVATPDKTRCEYCPYSRICGKQ